MSRPIGLDIRAADRRSRRFSTGLDGPSTGPADQPRPALDLLYFVLFVSILIFIHEFGHFAFAKLFGVKVLTFSIGFGPKILKVRGKETEYCIGLLPFGGFVKMLEEGKAERGRSSPRSGTGPSSRRRSGSASSSSSPGPAMNLVFPMALYTSVYLEDSEFLPPTVGAVFPGKPADGKLFPGDTITVDRRRGGRELPRRAEGLREARGHADARARSIATASPST